MRDIATMTDDERAALVKASRQARPNAKQRHEIEEIKQAIRARAA